jgi:riboflavin synthase
MFTGIVSGLGRLVSVERRRGGARLIVAPPRRYGRFHRGESVCISGVCLTAIRSGRQFVADLSEETLARSTLGSLAPEEPVNLERALKWGDRLAGHFVLGHVDAVARVLAIGEAGSSWLYRFSIPAGLSRFVVPKGSVAIDGISLTVAARRPRAFDVAIIPETRRRTTLSQAVPGAPVNFEVDLFARYGAGGWSRRVRRELPRRRR